MFRIIFTLLTLCAVVGSPVVAQQVIVTEPTPTVYYTVPGSYPLHATETRVVSPFEARFPHAARALQVIADPTLVLPNRANYSWNQPSDHPIFDAAPTIVSVTIDALSIGASGTIVTIGMFVPMAIRLLRVVLYGPPLPGTRAETLLWVALPTVARVRLARKENGGLFHPPLIQRPLLPWRRNATPYCR